MASKLYKHRPEKSVERYHPSIFRNLCQNDPKIPFSIQIFLGHADFTLLYDLTGWKKRIRNRLLHRQLLYAWITEGTWNMILTSVHTSDNTLPDSPPKTNPQNLRTLTPILEVRTPVAKAIWGKNERNQFRVIGKNKCCGKVLQVGFQY